MTDDLGLNLLEVCKNSLKVYNESSRCKWCKSESEVLLKALDELIAIHTKALDFVDVLDKSNSLRELSKKYHE